MISVQTDLTQSKTFRTFRKLILPGEFVAHELEVLEELDGTEAVLALLLLRKHVVRHHLGMDAAAWRKEERRELSEKDRMSEMRENEENQNITRMNTHVQSLLSKNVTNLREALWLLLIFTLEGNFLDVPRQVVNKLKIFEYSCVK